ncbi:hypothetical protein ASPBRDRAFT_33214 [Aspergillus brasiliensis CBS 101740]|uniref:Terpene synthase n=1 Tax=Aspergillus brasiliensis (strain CBS 101740 / IMI 381727 / IBT 21946) TaxID=767769 RepID=A0A1L9UAB4_ASPBC|nr:hypothetical protein ASPBRDRAFT_33214 [Aspergillus brasiliensis CBS 101740]
MGQIFSSEQNPTEGATSDPLGEFFTVVSAFLKEIFLAVPDVPDDKPFDEEVFHHFMRCGLPSDVVYKYSKGAAFMARCFYPHLDRDTQLSIGVWTAYIFSIDDLCEGAEFREHLKEYRAYLLGTNPPKWAYLSGLFSSLHDLCDRYDPFVGDMILKSSLDYISVNVFEVEHRGNLKVDPNTRLFPEFLRQKSGIGEAYAFANFPKGNLDSVSYITLVPDLAAVVPKLNDVVSFYKESIVGKEQDTHVMHLAAVEGCSPHEALVMIADQCLDSIRRVRAACMGDEALWNVVNQFLQGYALYHLEWPRYHLEDFGDYREWLSK